MPPGGTDAVAVADDPKDFARAIARIHDSPELWHRMSDAGVAYARDNFSIEAITAKVRRMLEDLGLPP
jgi:glycosyltransferase involved in cell wall biosynthesis